jgi:hypothetical protein
MMSFYFPYNNCICGYWWHFYNISHYESSMMGITVPPKVSVNWPVAFRVTSIKSMTTLESNCMHLLLIFTLKSTKKIKNEFTFPIVNFTFHQYQYFSSISTTRVKIWQLVLYVPSILIFWTELSCWRRSYSNKDTLL